jgi:hypothetical protein
MNRNHVSQLVLSSLLLSVGASASAQGVQRSVDEKVRTTYSDQPASRPAGKPQYGESAVIDYSGRYSAPNAPGFKTSGSTTRPVNPYDKTIDQRVNEHNQRLAESKARDQAMRDAAEQRERDRQLREARARVENDKRKLRELQYENDRR